MNFEAQYPIHPILKKHIQYYYLVKTNTRNHYCRYYSFPNTTIPINIHRNVHCKIEGNKVCVSGIERNNYLTISNGLRESPLLVEWSGIIDKVTIAFTCTGLNYFINTELNKAVNGYTNLFENWNGKAYTHALNNFFASDNITKKIVALEDFLLSIYHPFDKADIIERAIQLLSNFDRQMTIHEIAQEINASVRTLNRLFKTYTGVSPITYRKIARFRQSLENKIVKEKFKRLTDIGYESNYYDQSYFIKMYNKLSGKSPKDLYKAVNKLADNNVIFEFLENTIDFGRKIQFTKDVILQVCRKNAL